MCANTVGRQTVSRHLLAYDDGPTISILFCFFLAPSALFSACRERRTIEEFPDARHNFLPSQCPFVVFVHSGEPFVLFSFWDLATLFRKGTASPFPSGVLGWPVFDPAFRSNAAVRTYHCFGRMALSSCVAVTYRMRRVLRKKKRCR